MEPEGPLTHSQVSATSPYPEQLHLVYTPISYFLKIHLNIILPSKTEPSKWSLFLRFPNQNPVYASPIPIRATCPAYLILLDFITRTISLVPVMS